MGIKTIAEGRQVKRVIARGTWREGGVEVESVG